MTLRRRSAPDRIAMCQHPEGTHEHVPLKPGEKVGACFAECDCTPAVYVAVDAVAARLRERGEERIDGWSPAINWREAARFVELEFGDEDALEGQ